MHAGSHSRSTAADALSVKPRESPSGQRMQWLSCELPSQKHLVCVHGRSTAWCLPKGGCRASPRNTARRLHLFERHGGSPALKYKTVDARRDAAEAVPTTAAANALCAHFFGGPVASKRWRRRACRPRGARSFVFKLGGNKPGTARSKTIFARSWLITKAFAFKTAAKSSEDANAVFVRSAEGETARYTSTTEILKVVDLGDHQRSLPRWPTEDGR